MLLLSPMVRFDKIAKGPKNITFYIITWCNTYLVNLYAYLYEILIETILN